ncbi:MAG: stage 0 sporulation protein, partial [Clostridia bacterium]|nr:stage 0 sporulation protein [Clostridia bacterium]
MSEIVGIRFKQVGKIYYFSPNGIEFKIGDGAIVETARGVEFGKVVIANREEAEENIIKPLKPVLRKATDEDVDKVLKNNSKRAEAIKICEQKIKNRGLEMKLVDAEYTF